MKNIKKIVSLILAVCMIASFAVVASAAEPNTVSTATDAKIINNSFGAVKVNSNKFCFSLRLGNGAAKLTDNKNASKQTLLNAAIEGCFMSGVGDTSTNSIIGISQGLTIPIPMAVVLLCDV